MNSSSPPAPSQVRAYLQLVRLPNVFTAFADVLLGYFITHPALVVSAQLVALVCATGGLYLAGMVLNDVFDRNVDAVERPQRPIPSGRVSLQRAALLGWGLLASGVLAAAMASFFSSDGRLFPGTLAIALALAALVVGYDAVLKKTPLGPIAMGGCRALNVLLGLSAAPFDAWQPMHLGIAAALGAYVAGLTWFARDEAAMSRRVQLVCAATVMLGAIAALWQYPRWTGDDLTDGFTPVYALLDPRRWNALWLASALLVGHRLARAIAQPTPKNVQTAVKTSILSIVVLDAMCCYGVQGVGPATIILALLLPALFLGRWVYST